MTAQLSLPLKLLGSLAQVLQWHAWLNYGNSKVIFFINKSKIKYEFVLAYVRTRAVDYGLQVRYDLV